MGKAYYKALGYYPGSIGGLKFKLDPYHIGFWRNVEKGRWEPHTFKILSELIGSDTIYCDLGAWIGPTVLYAARKCREVVCFEPDPVAFRYLYWNIELNGLSNIRAFNGALADCNAILKMSSLGKCLGDSMTSLLAADKGGNGIDVITMTWEKFIELSHIDKIDFIKIDIEGGEFQLLPAMKKYLVSYKPVIYLSIHPFYLDPAIRREKKRQILELMKIYGKCLDMNLVRLDIDSLISSDSYGNSFLFLD
ncbi:MAG: FkbM family methyltransferase [Candidatus Cloacimonetes bacterium]|nr:FkbM family methyltransferase [Candidatus Cloacimonadota bacterium]